MLKLKNKANIEICHETTSIIRRTSPRACISAIVERRKEFLQAKTPIY